MGLVGLNAESDPIDCFPQAMALIALAAICFFVCVFLLFVLFQWTRDAKRKTTTRSAEDDLASETSEKKRPQLVGSRKAPKEHDRSMGRSCRASSTGGSRPFAGLRATSANGLRMRGS